MNTEVTPPTAPVCRVCTLHLERLCDRRSWWFRPFREGLGAGIRLFALAYRIPPESGTPRSPYCHQCLRFRKNALKLRSPLFVRLDNRLNPVFNRIRDSLLTPEELATARELALRREDPDAL